MARRFAILGMLAALSACAGAAREDVPSPSPVRPAVAPSAPDRTCHAALSTRRAGYDPLPDRYFGPGCSTTGTVALSELSGDRRRIAVTNLGAVTCPLAATFADWARFGVDRAARQELGAGLARIETMGSYSCRNIAGSSRRSAHSTGDAIDVSGFVLTDGRRVTLTGGWHGQADERRFLRLIHRSACRRFGTVLGPDYNRAHDDHFHLERTGRNFCR